MIHPEIYRQYGLNEDSQIGRILSIKDQKPGEGLNLARVNELLAFKELKGSAEDLPETTNEEAFMQKYKETVEPDINERKQKE